MRLRSLSPTVTIVDDPVDENGDVPAPLAVQYPDPFGHVACVLGLHKRTEESPDRCVRCHAVKGVP